MRKTLKISIIAITSLFMLLIFINVVNAVNNVNEKITYFTGTTNNGGPGTNLLNATTGDTFTDTVKLRNISEFDANNQIVAIKNAGYEFNGWKLVDNSSTGVLASGEPSRVTSDTSKAVYTIMGEKGWLSGTNSVVGGFAVVAQWKLKVYDVTVNSGVENGSIEASAEKVNHGSSCEITVTPDVGYEISNLVIEMDGTKLVEETDYSKNENVYTINEVTGDVDAEVTFSKTSFDISTNVIGGNGTITDSTTVEYGNDFVITLTPASGYVLNYLEVDGAKVEVTGNIYTLSNVKAEHDVKVSYKKMPFILNIVGMDGATVEPTGAIIVHYGDNKTILIKANRGYNLVSVTVNGEKAELTNDALELKNISKNTEVVVLVEKIVYNILEGQDLKTSDLSKLIFRIDADYSKFTNGGKVFVDDVELNNTQYTSESGSTIITLTDEFAKTLSVGNHTIKVVFNDGAEVATNFTIENATTTDTIPSEQTEQKAEKNIANPKTEDNIVIYSIVFVVALLGITTFIAVNNRKKVIE